MGVAAHLGAPLETCPRAPGNASLDLDFFHPVEAVRLGTSYLHCYQYRPPVLAAAVSVASAGCLKGIAVIRSADGPRYSQWFFRVLPERA